jgi:uncharacterized membrane protein
MRGWAQPHILQWQDAQGPGIVNPVSVVLPAAWTIAGWSIALPVLLWAVRRAPWSRFASSEQVHVWYGTIFALIVLWSIRATVGIGFTFHLLGVAALTLIAGPALAFVGTAVAIAISIIVRGGLWMNGGVAFVAIAIAPVATTWLVLRLAERWLPPNFFVYVFVVTFFGAALSLGAAGLTGAVVLAFGALQPADLVFGEYVPYLVYLAFGEATLTGMVLTLMVVYRPHWVATFDDARYLNDRPGLR